MIKYQIIESPFGDVLLGRRAGKIVFCHFAMPSLEAVLERVRSDFPGKEIVKEDSLLRPGGGEVIGERIGALNVEEMCLDRGENVCGVQSGKQNGDKTCLGEGMPGRKFSFEEILRGRGSIFRWEDLQLRGTALQMAVWREMFNLLPDELITYSQLAARCGYPSAVRAVATAVGKNPISLIIPCHRVIRSEALVCRGKAFATEKTDVVEGGAARNHTKGSAVGKEREEGSKINVSKLGNYYWGKEFKIKILEWEELI